MSYLSPADIEDACRLHERDPNHFTISKLVEIYHVPESLIQAALTRVGVTVKSENFECGWTPARVEIARDLWLDGKSAGEIAKQLKTTRNACISKLHRMGLTGGGTAKKRASRAGRRYGRVTMAAILLESRRRSPGLVERKGPEEAPGMRKLPLVELKRNQCHWPFNHPGKPDFHYCGADIETEGRPYCSYHCDIAYRKVGEG